MANFINGSFDREGEDAPTSKCGPGYCLFVLSRALQSIGRLSCTVMTGQHNKTLIFLNRFVN